MNIALIVTISILGTVVVASMAIIAARAHRHPEEALERTNTVTDEFIDNPIKSGCYIFVGPQGIGKTSLMIAMLLVDFKYHGEYRLEVGKNAIDKLNAIVQEKPYHLKMPDCAYRTRSLVMLPNGKPTYHTDISQFGLPGKPGIQYFPEGTVICCDEIDSFMDCRKWQENKQDLIDGLKYIRHNDLVFMGDCQNFSKLDISVRRLTTDLIIVEGKKDIWHTIKGRLWKKSRRELYGTEWTFKWIKKQLLDNANSLCTEGYKANTAVYARQCKFFYRGNIYKQYDSKSGKPYWYNGLENYEVEKHIKCELSREGIKEFVKRNALTKVEDEKSKADDTQLA